MSTSMKVIGVQCAETLQINNCYIIDQVTLSFKIYVTFKLPHFHYFCNNHCILPGKNYTYSFNNKFTDVQNHSLLLLAQFVSPAPVVLPIPVLKQ